MAAHRTAQMSVTFRHFLMTAAVGCIRESGESTGLWWTTVLLGNTICSLMWQRLRNWLMIGGGHEHQWPLLTSVGSVWRITNTLAFTLTKSGLKTQKPSIGGGERSLFSEKTSARRCSGRFMSLCWPEPSFMMRCVGAADSTDPVNVMVNVEKES